MTEYLGFKWLSETLNIDPVQPFRVQSRIGSTRETLISDGYVQQTFPTQFCLAPTLRAHLQFALKYEVMHLEFLSRLFGAIAPAELEQWIHESPTGQYARQGAQRLVTSTRTFSEDYSWHPGVASSPSVPQVASRPFASLASTCRPVS